MKKPAVEIINLSKKYLISHEREAVYTTLRETLANYGSRIWNKIRNSSYSSNGKNQLEELWALKKLSLKVTAGSRIGIIGRNGAGKSTLLKILSRVTTPTSGQVKIRGRVASLLEVGTGFHPELNGRENIFLNGAILGMSKLEIIEKFDQIVAFSGLEKFLDTPIKRYSSGMIARLAFSVAAHLDPDILIVDEVLAVGDLKFQEKCLKKMNEISGQGRTVFFVSHNMSSVLSLCDKVLFLDRGQLVTYGDCEICVAQYMETYSTKQTKWCGNVGNSILRVHQAEIENAVSGNNRISFNQGETAKLTVDYEVLSPSEDLVIHINVWHRRGQLLAESRLCPDQVHYRNALEVGKHKLQFQFDTHIFQPGDYFVKFEVWSHPHIKIISDDIVLNMTIHSGSEHSRLESGNGEGAVILGSDWSICNNELVTV